MLLIRSEDVCERTMMIPLSEIQRLCDEVSALTGKKFEYGFCDGCIFFKERRDNQWIQLLFTAMDNVNGRDRMRTFISGFISGIRNYKCL